VNLTIFETLDSIGPALHFWCIDYYFVNAKQDVA